MKKFIIAMILAIASVASAQVTKMQWTMVDTLQYPDGRKVLIAYVLADSVSITDSLTVLGPAKINGITALPSTTTISNAFTATGAFTLTNATTTIGRDSSTAAITSGTITGTTFDNGAIGGSTPSTGDFTTLESDSLNVGSGDLIVAPTQNEVRIPNSNVSIGHSSAPTNAIDLQWANGKNDTNYLVRLINSDVTSGEDKGVYIQAGSSGGATEVLRVDGSASGRHFTVLGSGFTGVGTVVPTQTFVINDSNARGGGKVAFEKDGTRYGAVGTGAWALGDGSTDITVLADAGHGFKVGTNGSVSFVITSGKDSGFGDTSPNGKVHIVGAGGAASGAAYATNPTLILEDGTSPILQFSSPSGSGDVQQILFGDSDSDVGQINYNHSADSLYVVVNTSLRLSMTTQGNFVIGNAALGTTATDGFLYIPSTAGTPTGAPTAYAGRTALVYDFTNNLLYANDGGGWVAVNSP